MTAMLGLVDFVRAARNTVRLALGRVHPLAGPVLAVRPYCNNAHYWQVYFDANKLIREGLAGPSFPVPEQHLVTRAAAAAASAGN